MIVISNKNQTILNRLLKKIYLTNSTKFQQNIQIANQKILEQKILEIVAVKLNNNLNVLLNRGK